MVLWDKIRQAITLERVIYVIALLVVAGVSFMIGYTTPSYSKQSQLNTMPSEYTDIVTTATSGFVTTSTTKSVDISAKMSTASIISISTTTTMPVSTNTTATTATQPSFASIPTGKIPINSASKEQLMTVSGIGEVFAQRIIDYRELNNGFTDIAELKNIKGIGDARFNKWKDSFVID